MKRILIVSFVFAVMLTKAQYGGDCYNRDIVSRQEKIKETPINNAQAAPLILMPYVMKEKEVQLILKEKKNFEITFLLKKTDLYRRLQRVGFIGIPAGIIGAACVASVNMFGAPTNRIDKQQQNIGLGLIALAPICLGTSVYFKSQRNKNYKKAIAKYNQLYN